MNQEIRLKAILDPLLFWIPDGPKIDKVSVLGVLASIDFAVMLSRRGVEIATTPATWERIKRQFLLPLGTKIPSNYLFPRIKALDDLLKFVEPPLAHGETWGFRTLFSFVGLQDQEAWMSALARLAAYWLSTQEDFVLLLRLLEGRNLTRHSAGHRVVWEKTHWRVFLKSDAGVGNGAVKCVSSLRNLDVEWTRRYDDRLPDTAPGGGAPFFPAADWENPAVKVIRTVLAKPAWIDAGGNAWTDTNTPGKAHHWDVFPSEPHLLNKFGKHVNITCWGTDDRNRVPGSVHH